MSSSALWRCDWWLSLQPPSHAGSPLADFSTLKMEAIRSSEISVDARYTQRHIPEDNILQEKSSSKFCIFFASWAPQITFRK
jgi:hypothetical protein